MRIPGARSLSRAARCGLSTLLAALLGSGGCTFLVGAELSDKPEEGTGAGGGGGQGGAGAMATSAETTSGPSSVSSGDITSSASGPNVSVGTGVGSSSAGSGGTMCSTDLADCDGKPENGCETNTKTDSKNCGSCLHTCAKPMSCKKSKCK